MSRKILAALLLFWSAIASAQQVIPLYKGAAPGSENWTYNEQEFNMMGMPIVYNISHPTLTAYLPDPKIATGTGVIICPGGGFYILAVKIEGTDLAKWLNEKGVACFILKYRTAQSHTDNPVQELGAYMQKKDEFIKAITPYVPLAIADGREAIKYVRAHAAEYNLSPSRIGIVGFSAGGAVAGACGFNYNAENRPDFDAPIYGYLPPEILGPVNADTPPFFIAVANNDELGINGLSVNLYSKLSEAKHPVELHIYEKGGHGFGTKKQNIPTDTWYERFGDWLGLHGLLKPIDPKAEAEIEERAKNAKFYADLPHTDWAFLQKYEKQNEAVPPPAPGEKRIVFMGNSITEGWRYADSAFFTGRPYYDRGISGQTTGQMLVRFREDVINLKPSVVVILAGINDIAQNNGPEKIEDIFGNIKSMAELARMDHIKVVISSILPAYAIPWRPAIDPKPGVAAMNKLLKTYCEKNHIVYLDYYSAMADEQAGLPSSLSGDGVHPTLAGYKVMEPLAEKAIAEALKRKE